MKKNMRIGFVRSTNVEDAGRQGTFYRRHLELVELELWNDDASSSFGFFLSSYCEISVHGNQVLVPCALGCSLGITTLNEVRPMEGLPTGNINT